MGLIWADQEAAHRVRKWRQNCTMPGAESAAAMRALLGLTPRQAASRAGVPLQWLQAFEANWINPLNSTVVSHRLDAAYRALGARWYEPDLHDGACCVFLETGFADDRRAILAALELMGCTIGKRPRKVTVQLLAKRVEATNKIAEADLRKALHGRGALSAKMATACFRQLGEGRGGAGCYFVAAQLTGWRAVGCDYQGSWW